jgi:hypothetical protein
MNSALAPVEFSKLPMSQVTKIFAVMKLELNTVYEPSPNKIGKTILKILVLLLALSLCSETKTINDGELPSEGRINNAFDLILGKITEPELST